jgi:pimeloyl-ACP methyl ester carboxylesterase
VAGDAPPLHDGYGAGGRSAWMDIDWPAHQRWISVDGTPANVVELGEGPPLLFVHGLSGCWQNWLENIPRFARTHRVIAVDLPGFGASPMPAEPIAIAGYAGFLERLCDALGVERAAVVGNSMGGHIAAAFTIAAPERVERLALVSPAGVSAAHANRQVVLSVGRALALTSDRTVAAVDALARRPGLRRLALGLVCHRPDLLSAPLARELMRGSGKPAFLPALEAVLAHPLEERLGEIACPALLVWGREDHVIPVRDAKAFARAIPHMHVEIWPHTGHVAMLERPARFNALLEGFLSDAPPVVEAAPAAALSE